MKKYFSFDYTSRFGYFGVPGVSCLNILGVHACILGVRDAPYGCPVKPCTCEALDDPIVAKHFKQGTRAQT